MNLNPSEIVYLANSSALVMMDFAQQHPHKEIIGVFFGIIKENGDILIKEAYPFRVGRHTNVHFEDQDYEDVVPLIKECLARKFEWLGWFHSHPFKGGDHIYMSKTDISYQYPAQSQNPFWTAIVINPYQINDPTTVRGMRAFRLLDNSKNLDKSKLTRKVQNLRLIIQN